MQFIVEVPAYVRVEIEAPDAEEAAYEAERLLHKGPPMRGGIVHAAGRWQFIAPRLQLLAPDVEDREPDVYLCRGGKLNLINDKGAPEPLDEECG